MHKDALIKAAALRGSSFEDHRYATPFDDLDILLFIERPEREAEIVKRLGEIRDCRSISYLPPQKFEYGEHSASHSSRTRQVRMGGVGRYDLEFDLITMKDWIEFVERTRSKEYSVETILTSKAVLGRSYLEENRKAITEALASRRR